jgi:hypothetical protein
MFDVRYEILKRFPIGEAYNSGLYNQKSQFKPASPVRLPSQAAGRAADF